MQDENGRLRAQLEEAEREMEQMSLEFDEAIDVLSKERDDIYSVAREEIEVQLREEFASSLEKGLVAESDVIELVRLLKRATGAIKTLDEQYAPGAPNSFAETQATQPRGPAPAPTSIGGVGAQQDNDRVPPAVPTNGNRANNDHDVYNRKSPRGDREIFVQQQQKHLQGVEGRHSAYAPSPEPASYARPLPYQPIASPTRFCPDGDESEVCAAIPAASATEPSGGFSPTGFGATGFDPDLTHKNDRPQPPVYYSRHGGAEPLYQSRAQQEDGPAK